MRDLVGYFGTSVDGFSLRAILREPLRVPETKPIGELLRDFQVSEVHMAVVVDEYGGTSGLCTIEDVIEEIVGEIHDEHEPHDELPPVMLEIEDGRFAADGRLTIAEVNERLGLSLPEDAEFDTVAGLLLDRLGRVPTAGERDETPEAIFEVAEATPTRIDKVLIALRGNLAREDSSADTERSDAEDSAAERSAATPSRAASSVERAAAEGSTDGTAVAPDETDGRRIPNAAPRPDGRY